ncbi:TetR/AcrR family transcriptional regulator C-terminal domain-containing protein [Streptomyces sp. NPDC006733]|uniref:TetR/AcrR family transcriptional regulator C-terminal domain-containing protein n=1 Tax=Streptomyces sp. NPDC006733 TaxID=3155460 RepID=UPI00340D4D0B
MTPSAAAGPPYVRIVDEIRRRIAAGELAAGERVPSTRGITREFGVAMATATKVLTALRQEGLVQVLPGIGTVVAEPGPRPARTREPAREQIRVRTRAQTGEQTREPARELTRERIVLTAIGIADREGLAAVSMRRIAAELGVAAMALYRHVPGKDELVVLMADEAAGRGELPEPGPSDWRERLEQGTRLQWRMYRRHPWLAPVMSMTRPPLVPNAMAIVEWSVRALDHLDPADMLHVAVTMVNYARGTAVNLEAEAEAEHSTGITSAQYLNANETAMQAIVSSGRFPMYSTVAGRHDLEIDLDTIFEFGLGRLLDGIEVFVSR